MFVKAVRFIVSIRRMFIKTLLTHLPTVVLVIGFWIATQFSRSDLSWGVGVVDGIHLCLMVLIAKWLVFGAEYSAVRMIVSITLFIVLCTRLIRSIENEMIYHVGLTELVAILFTVIALQFFRVACDVQIANSKSHLPCPRYGKTKFPLSMLFVATICVALIAISLKYTWPRRSFQFDQFVAYTILAIVGNSGLTSVLSLPCFYMSLRASEPKHFCLGVCLLGILSVANYCAVYLIFHLTRGMKMTEKFFSYQQFTFSAFTVSFIVTLIISQLWCRAFGEKIEFGKEGS
jgi:hypothetical protein